jgi:hypothetical protein
MMKMPGIPKLCGSVYLQRFFNESPQRKFVTSTCLLVLCKKGFGPASEEYTVLGQTCGNNNSNHLYANRIRSNFKAFQDCIMQSRHGTR